MPLMEGSARSTLLIALQQLLRMFVFTFLVRLIFLECEEEEDKNKMYTSKTSVNLLVLFEPS